MARHTLAATVVTVQIGVFDAAFPPVLTIMSGDTVVVECVSGRPKVLPPAGSGLTVPDSLAAILATNPGNGPGRIITGPIAVSDAQPGDMLEVHIDAIELGANWGYNGARPQAGTLPMDFDEPALIHIQVDRARRTCTLPWGTELPRPQQWSSDDALAPSSFGAARSLRGFRGVKLAGARGLATPGG